MHPDLLAAVLAAPDDDGPRLVYADWLEENGDPERAEFIRVQIEIARRNGLAAVQPSTAEYHLIARERILLHRCGDAWLAPLRAKGEPLMNRSSHGQFVRGFVEIVWMTATTFLKRGETLFRRAPVRELRVTRAMENECALLFRSGLLTRLTALDLSGRMLDHGLVERLVNVIDSTTVRRLRLRNCGIDDEGAEALTRFHSGLLELDVRDNPISDRGIARLREHFGDAIWFWNR